MTVGLLVTVAAGLGAVARYVVDQVVQHRTRADFPYGTFAINMSGSFLLGLVTGLAVHHGLGHEPAAVLGVGFTGGYTTFSTWVWETVALGERGEARGGLVNIVGSVAVGLAAAAAGLGVALL